MVFSNFDLPRVIQEDVAFWNSATTSKRRSGDIKQGEL